MMYYVQCPKCGSFETICNTKVDVKFKPFQDDHFVKQFKVLSTESDITSQIKHQIDKGASFEAECDTCGHHFVVKEV